MRGKERFIEIFNKYSKTHKIILYGDPDVDGLMSLKLMADYMDMLGLQYTYYVNQNRSHGFELPLSMLRGYFIIAADFAITYDVMKSLVDSGVPCINIDHHVCQEEFIDIRGGTADGIVINNQYPFEPDEDRYLSGAGVVYELFTSITPEFASDERRSMVGITLLSDVRSIENSEAHKYLATLFVNDSDYIKYLIDETNVSDFSFGVPKMDRTFVDFTFSPTVNAMLRYNKVDEAINFIFGHGIGDGRVYREMQRDLVRRLKNTAEVLEMPNTTIIAINADDFEEDISNFIGLACSSYKNMGKSSLIFAYRGGKVLRASFRGEYDDISYLKLLRGLGIDAEGHNSAFGIKNFYPNKDVWQSIEECIGGIEREHKDTRTILDVQNLSMIMANKGSKIAYDNCFVRDMYRTYIRYKGSNVRELLHTYRFIEFNDQDYINKRKPDKVLKGVSYKYELDKNGDKITKYIEYIVDGRKVKSFGVTISDGLILPILEKGYIQLYVV